MNGKRIIRNVWPAPDLACDIDVIYDPKHVNAASAKLLAAQDAWKRVVALMGVWSWVRLSLGSEAPIMSSVIARLMQIQPRHSLAANPRLMSMNGDRKKSRDFVQSSSNGVYTQKGSLPGCKRST